MLASRGTATQLMKTVFQGETQFQKTHQQPHASEQSASPFGFAVTFPEQPGQNRMETYRETLKCVAVKINHC